MGRLAIDFPLRLLRQLEPLLSHLRDMLSIGAKRHPVGDLKTLGGQAVIYFCASDSGMISPQTTSPNRMRS
jgi:hypothetical protein